MLRRSLNITKNNSFFLFGARGTGKTSLISSTMEFAREINLLLPDEFFKFSARPALLSEQLKSIPKNSWIFIDEIQRVPALLDLVHYHIEKDQIKFALTGSSARKLRRGAANLLAGRAFTYLLYPLTVAELGNQFDLLSTLKFGTLPKLLSLTEVEDKKTYLESYAHTYLQEEIWNEQIIRSLSPFQKFLQVAAQMNGEIINFSKIADDVGVDEKTVKAYFHILEDTLIGYFLESFDRSVRKRQNKNPKFYFFDTGIKNALDGTIGQDLIPGSSSYGKAFEHFFILEVIRLNSYLRKNYRFYYLRSKDGAEIDLIIERPNDNPLLIEIKSTDNTSERDLRHLKQYAKDFKDGELICICNETFPREVDGIKILPWKMGLEMYFGD